VRVLLGPQCFEGGDGLAAGAVGGDGLIDQLDRRSTRPLGG
jgi:hypothetical protein